MERLLSGETECNCRRRLVIADCCRLPIGEAGANRYDCFQTAFFEAQKNFADAEKFCMSQDSLYQELDKKAMEYSLVKTTAPQLEQLKGQEQSVFAELQQQYETAKSLSQEFPAFQPRFQQIEEKYIDLKNQSEKIQALEYKPWIQRVKDYLYSFAAVAMILMFINMVQAKIKALKQARENAKKLREALNNEEDDYPTI